MPLTGTANTLGQTLARELQTTKDLGEAWAKVAEILLSHIAANALVTGTTPNGGPMRDGKIS
jgi:hypothetical protein